MDAIECITNRISIRKFKPEEVPEDKLLRIFEIARFSPSYKNSQPWQAVIVSGSKKEALSKMLTNLIESGVTPKPDIPIAKTWTPEIQERITLNLKKRSEIFGIDLLDPETIKRSKIANYNFYGAPHGIFLYQDASLPEWSLFDLGIFAQTLMLAAFAEGLGTVAQAFLTEYAPQIKEFLGIPASNRLILGISIGYPDTESPINKYKSSRLEATEIVRFVRE